MRSPNYKLTCWVDVVLDIVVEQLCVFLILGLDAGNEDVDDDLLPDPSMLTNPFGGAGSPFNLPTI